MAQPNQSPPVWFPQSNFVLIFPWVFWGAGGLGGGTDVDKRAGFLSLGSTALWGRSFFVIKGCPLPYRLPLSLHPCTPQL